jgi:hypothetical protein
MRDQDRVVDIATHYGLTVRGSKPCGGGIFPTRPDHHRYQPSLVYEEYRDSFMAAKRLGVALTIRI